MSSRVLSVAFLLASATVFAQNNPPASTPVVYHWSSGATGSEATDVHNTHILVQKSPVADVAVSIREVGNYVRTYVQILNHGSDAVTFDPMTASLELVTKKPKTFAAIPPEKAAHGIESDAYETQQEGLQGNCAMLTAGCSPTDTSMAAGKDAAAIGGREGALARTDGLKSTIVVKQNEQLQGSIYFKPDRKRQDVLIRIPFGNGVFEFPFTLGKK